MQHVREAIFCQVKFLSSFDSLMIHFFAYDLCPFLNNSPIILRTSASC